MGAEKYRFVFVVCGGREHIETLHFSLAALKLFTATEIVVVTDESKNEKRVAHDHVINVPTPPNLNNHQSAIYLKTGLHKFLPKGFIYCYLDTDVIAISNEVDDVFNYKSGSITFATDHCSLTQFSPHAVNCGCAEKNANDHNEIKSLLAKYGYNPPAITSELLQKQKQLKHRLELIKHSNGLLLMSAINYLLSPKVFKLDNDFFYHRNKYLWSDAEGNPILYEVPPTVINEVEKNSAWRWKRKSRRWINPQGQDIEWLACTHLYDVIQDKFKVEVNKRWQHWNGGVFLFDDASHEFMEKWHQNTLAIFDDPYWKTRDQGTLVATVWQLGLQQAPLLSKKFNFIAYFYNPALMISADKSSISYNALVTQYQPAFVHVFDHFGERGWEVWDWIENKLEQQKLKHRSAGNL